MTLTEPLSRPVRVRRTGVLSGYVLFHLNLMFSSIAEEQRGDVIARCYTPLLDLAERGIPLGIEATGLTLEIIQQLDPAWITRLRRLIASGQVEFVGSGYAQAIGPLLPAAAVEKNLALGLDTYRALLGVRPAIALVNEQAYSGGLVPLYRAAGYSAIVMDWDDCAAHHPEWNRHWRYHPQRAIGADGSAIAYMGPSEAKDTPTKPAILDGKTGKPIRQFTKHFLASEVSLSDDGKRAAVLFDAEATWCTFEVVDTATGEPVGRVRIAGKDIPTVTLSQDGRALVVHDPGTDRATLFDVP